MSKGTRRSTFFIALIIFLVISIVVAVQNKKPPEVQQTSEIPLTQYIQFTVNGTPLTIDAFQVGSSYETPMLTTEFETEITIGAFTGFEMKINGQTTQGDSSLNLQLKDLNKTEPIDIELRNLNNDYISHYYVPTLPPTFPDLVTNGKGEGDGSYYTALRNYILKIDMNGAITFYQNAVNSFDFKRTDIGEKKYYSYGTAFSHPDSPPLTGSANVQVKYTILDERFRNIDEISFLNTEKGIKANYPLDNHDIIVLEKGHYLIAGYVGKRINNIPNNVEHSEFGTRVIASVLQEVKDEKLIWQWDSTEHPELYNFSVEGNDYFNETLEWSDYAHFNSMVIDPKDQNLICSFRNLDAVLKIDRKSGQIIWILGGKGDQFGLSETQKFSRQHFARLTENGSLTLFDNNTNTNGVFPKEFTGSAKGVTRVLEMILNEQNFSIDEYNEYSIDKQYSPIMGSAQRLDEDREVFLVGWGGRETSNALFQEIDFTTKEILFEVMYPHNDFYSDIYRVFKFSK